METPTKSSPPKTTIISVTSPGQDLETVRHLFLEYQNYLGINLDFQGFQSECETLPGQYAPPHGRLYLAKQGNIAVGCTGFYPRSESTCELKRLYVKPTFHSRGIGHTLLQHAIEEARTIGYEALVLDSLRRLEGAARLYQRFNFQEIPPYNKNTTPDVYYMRLEL